MWAIITSDDSLVDERQCLWPDLGDDVRIKKLLWRDRRGQIGGLEGFKLYGFQRYSFSGPGQGRVQHAGTQLIGVIGDEVTVVDINENTGERSSKKLPLSELTYAPELLRHGIEG